MPARSTSLIQRYSASIATDSNLPIDQPGHGTCMRGVIPAMMAIGLMQAWIPARPANRVFDLDPSLRESAIAGNVLLGAIFLARFAPRRRA